MKMRALLAPVALLVAGLLSGCQTGGYGQGGGCPGGQCGLGGPSYGGAPSYSAPQLQSAPVYNGGGYGGYGSR